MTITQLQKLLAEVEGDHDTLEVYVLHGPEWARGVELRPVMRGDNPPLPPGIGITWETPPSDPNTPSMFSGPQRDIPTDPGFVMEPTTLQPTVPDEH